MLSGWRRRNWHHICQKKARLLRGLNRGTCWCTTQTVKSSERPGAILPVRRKTPWPDAVIHHHHSSLNGAVREAEMSEMLVRSLMVRLAQTGFVLDPYLVAEFKGL